jgi:hypothetical protein
MNLIDQLREWLKPEGINHFKQIKEKYGKISAIWDEDGIPHCVHFREGMQVRNQLRILIPNMSDHWYDDNWEILIEKTIK